MGRLNFGRLTTPPVPHHFHDDGDAVDEDAVEGIQHGLLSRHPSTDVATLDFWLLFASFL